MITRIVTIPACLTQDNHNRMYTMIDTSFAYDVPIVISDFTPEPIFYPASQPPPDTYPGKDVKSQFNIIGVGWYTSILSRSEIIEAIHFAATGDAT